MRQNETNFDTDIKIQRKYLQIRKQAQWQHRGKGKYTGSGFLVGNFVDGILIGQKSMEKVEEILGKWREAMEDGRLRISKQKVRYLWFGGDSKEGERKLLGGE